MKTLRRKAVSPVIATLLLILIAVAAAILVYIWITGYTSAVTRAGAPELEEKLKIEAISVNLTAKDITIYIRDIGNVETTIDAIYIIEAGTNEIIILVTTSITIKPGELKSVTISNVNLKEGVTYIVKVVTKSGVETSLSFVARK